MVDINLFSRSLLYFPFFVLSTSFLCSSSRVLCSIPVSPMYSAPQFLHGIWYTSSPCSSSSTLSLGCTNRRLRVVLGRMAVVTPHFISTRYILSSCTLYFTLPSTIVLNFASKKGMLLFYSSSRVKMKLPVGSTVFICFCNSFAFPVCTRQITLSTYIGTDEVDVIR